MDLVAEQWKRIWSDNSDPYDLNKGVLNFAKTLFPDTIKDYYGTSHIHQEMTAAFLELYNPKYRFLPERQLQEVIFRGASKSTLTNFVWVAYIACNNGHQILLPGGIPITLKEDLIVIASETNNLATNWTIRIRTELSSNAMLKRVYGKMKPDSLMDDQGKWRSDSFTVRRRDLPVPFTGKNVTILSRGVGQQIRGINVGGRITLAIVDDIYSRNNIKTPEARYNVAYWHNAELKNSIDMNEGKIVNVGTIVHEDTVTFANKSSADWKVIEYPIMPIVKFNEVLAKYCTIDRDALEMIIPCTGDCVKLEKMGYITEWPERFPLELLLIKMREAIRYQSNMTESMFWQEYFHVTKAEADKAIKRTMMRNCPITLLAEKIEGEYVPFVKVVIDGITEYRNVKTCISIDSATSYATKADNMAIGWLGKDFKNRLYIIKSQGGKYAFSDEFKPEFENMYLDKLCTNYDHIQRIGAADELFRWVEGTNQKPLLVIETNNAGSELAKQIRRKMRLYNMPLMMVEVVQTSQTGKKEDRIKDILSPYYQSRMVHHNTLPTIETQENLKHELEFLGSSRHDDEADMVATGVSRLTKPSVNVVYAKHQETIQSKPLKKWTVAGLSNLLSSDVIQNKWRTN